jgi:hypothetical protein
MSKRRTDRGPTSRPGFPALGGADWIHQDPRFRATLRRLDAGGFTWEALADDVLPVFERARPFSYPLDPPALMILPPGVTVGFGLDAGPAFMRIATSHLVGWPVDLAGLAERALGNLALRTRRAHPHDVQRGFVGEIPVDFFQSGDGWASTTVLVPDAIDRLFGPRPALFVAPTRDILIAMPADVDLAFATWVTEEVEANDPNALCLEGFEWRDGAIRCRSLTRASVVA